MKKRCTIAVDNGYGLRVEGSEDFREPLWTVVCNIMVEWT